ncbi:MAG: methylase, partial [Mesorhizobium sp.]
RDAFVRLQERGQVLFSAAIDGSVYARHGTTVETRLTVLDKIPAQDPARLIASNGTAPDLQTLLDRLTVLPPRSPSTSPHSIGALSNGILRAETAKRAARSSADMLRPAAVTAVPARPDASQHRPHAAPSPVSPPSRPIVELAYEIREAADETCGTLADGIYEPYQLQAISIPGAKPHPDKLVESTAMASVAPPK